VKGPASSSRPQGEEKEGVNIGQAAFNAGHLPKTTESEIEDKKLPSFRFSRREIKSDKEEKGLGTKITGKEDVVS